MIVYILLIVLFFAAFSLAPVLVATDPDAKSCILGRR